MILSKTEVRVPQMVSAGPGQDAPSAYDQRRQQAVSPTSQTGLEAGGSSRPSDAYEYAQGHQFSPQVQSQALQYSGEYGSEGTRQQFQPYPQNVLYNMAPAGSQPTEYEAVSQFNHRQSTGIETLSTQFGVPQYFSPGEPSSRPPQHAQAYPTSSYQQATQYSQRAQGGPPTTAAQYIPEVTDYSSATISAIMDPVEQPRQQSRSEELLAQIYTSLRRVYRGVQHGDLLQSGHQLLQVSEWVTTQALEMGLTRDDKVSQDARIEFWDSFNTCWLALLQKQKDASLEMIANGQPPPAGQTILQEDLLDRMAKQVMRMSDVLEQHGLVDYQIGIWEEEIMDECLDILEGDPEDYTTADLPADRSRAAQAARRSA